MPRPEELPPSKTNEEVLTELEKEYKELQEGIKNLLKEKA